MGCKISSEKLNEIAVLKCTNTEKIEYTEYNEILKTIFERKIFRKFFEQYSTDGKMSMSQFESFLANEQLQTINSLKKLKSSAFSCFSRDHQKKLFTFDDFNYFLNSDFNNAFPISKKNLYQDMTQPITHYWISSSHNTYLEGKFYFFIIFYFLFFIYFYFYFYLLFIIYYYFFFFFRRSNNK